MIPHSRLLGEIGAMLCSAYFFWCYLRSGKSIYLFFGGLLLGGIAVALVTK